MLQGHSLWFWPSGKPSETIVDKVSDDRHSLILDTIRYDCRVFGNSRIICTVLYNRDRTLLSYRDVLGVSWRGELWTGQGWDGVCRLLEGVMFPTEMKSSPTGYQCRPL